MTGGLFRHSAQAIHAEKTTPPVPVPLEHVSADLAELLAKTPHALAVVEHDHTTREDFAEVTREEILALRQATAQTRQPSAIANLLAARRAVTQCAAEHLSLNISPHDVQLGHDSDGKPELRFTDAAHTKAFQGLNISLADSHGLSVALIGPSPVGVDIEIVETRDCEAWRGLLGDDGYVLALKIERETGEPFDSAATRVWTLLEAGKKALSLRRVLPRFTGSFGGDWLTMSLETDSGACHLLSALVESSDAKSGVFAFAVALGSKLLAQPIRELPAEFHFDKFGFGLRADYSGPHGQIVVTKRFPVIFRDCQTASKKVGFARYASWMGDIREDSSLGIFPELIDQFLTDQWGMATNHYRLDVVGELSPGDVVEGRLWQERSTSDHLWLLKLDWRATGRDGQTRRVATSEMGFSWVQILSHGVGKLAPLPDFGRKFFAGMLPIVNAPARPLEVLPCAFDHLKIGPLLWQKTGLADNKTALFSHEILTTSENSNWVGNIYFANYGEWMARVRDLYFQRLTPDCFRNSGRDGEWVCLSCAIDHLSEAMPFDRILVTMEVAAIYRSAVKLTFDYFLLENNQISRKLAHGKHTMAWVGRDAHSEPVALDLPTTVMDTLTAKPVRQVPAKFQYDQLGLGFRAAYSGPQNQLQFTKRFPVLFRDCQTASKKVPFTRYAAWLGNVREDSFIGVFPELVELFGSGKWGMATNHYRLNILGDASPGDIMEGKIWQERTPNDRLWILKCEWRAIGINGKKSRVALSELGFSAVQIVSHGVARAETMPEVLREFVEEMLPAVDVAVKQLEALPCSFDHLQLGPLLWQETGLTDNKTALFSQEIRTTSENSNWVGNIYFANYGEWMARVRDLYFHRLTPDCFRNAGREGEWACLSCAIDHLSEAMPFDRILVTMNVAAIYRSGVDLTFDYFLLENNQIARKLAHGKHTMAWVSRDSRNEPITLELPQNVKKTLLKELKKSGKRAREGESDVLHLPFLKSSPSSGIECIVSSPIRQF